MQRKLAYAIALTSTLLTNSSIAAPTSAGFSLYIDRKDMQLYVLDAKGKSVLSDTIGIGAGGIKTKRSMSDAITPTGSFVVDIILYKDKSFAAVGADNARRFSAQTASPDRLATLYKNMDTCDFNHDGKPDHAYGDGYVGLQSTSGAITGPKLSKIDGVPYWYSIALHGTHDPHGLGTLSSGGCVHLSSPTLHKLIEQHIVAIGTTVKIADKPPAH